MAGFRTSRSVERQCPAKRSEGRCVAAAIYLVVGLVGAVLGVSDAEQFDEVVLGEVSESVNRRQRGQRSSTSVVAVASMS